MRSLSLNELYLEELKDLYDAESRLIKALPKMAEAAESAELRHGFESHLEQTKQHALRLEQIFERMGIGTETQEMRGHGRPDPRRGRLDGRRAL